MPRGEMLRTKIKREIIAAGSVATAMEEARAKIYDTRESKKPLEVSLREHVGKMIDRIDPLEFSAILAATVLIHDTYEWTESVLSNLNERKLSFETLIQSPAGIISDVYQWGVLFGSQQLGETLKRVPDPMVWLVSFVSAFFVVRHGSEIMNAVSNVLGMLKLLPI